MKQKAGKIIFILSFLPWLFVLLYGVYGAIFGASFFRTYYGWDGFYVGVMGAVLLLCFIPVLPACLVYEICYVLRCKVPQIQKIPIKKYIIGACIFYVTAILTAYVSFF